MNEKKQQLSQQQANNQLLTVSAHHQKRQQSLGVASNSGVPMIQGMPGHSQIIAGMHYNQGGSVLNGSNASAPGGIGLLMGSGTNNIVNINMQNMRGSGSNGAPSTNNYIQMNTENRAAAAQFIRNSYASGSRMKKASGNPNNVIGAGVNEPITTKSDSQDPSNRQHANATTHLLQQLEASGLIPPTTGSSVLGQAQMKKRGSQQSSNAISSSIIMDPNLGKKIKVMRNTHGSSGVSGGAQPSLLIVPSQQMALQGQLGNMSNIHNSLRQKSPVPKSPTNQQKQILLQQQNSTPNTNNGGVQVQQVNAAGPNTASLKSARRYQLMNSQQKNPSSAPNHHPQQMINVNSANLGVGGAQGGPGLLPTHTQLSPQNLSQQFQTQFQNSGGLNHGNQTLNIQQFKQQISNQKVNLSLERPANHNNDLILQSPNSSDTNSSINSLDQTLRLRIGGTLPKGMLSSSQSSSSGASGAGVHPNHFYQSSNLNRDMNASGMGNNSSALFVAGHNQMQQQQQQQAPLNNQLQIQPNGSNNVNNNNYNNLNHQSSNNSNFNSLDYSELAAMSSRRMHNESNNQGANFSQLQAQHNLANSSNVKRNNFLAIFNGGQDGGNNIDNSGGIKSPEGSHSQPNPPTLRKITLNQRILQKNMARVSASNQAQHQTIMNNQEANQNQDEGSITQVTGTIRQKKFTNGGQVPTKPSHLHQSAPSQQTLLGPRDTSVSSTASDQTNQPMINVARIQQAISKIYGSQRKNSILVNSQQQVPTTQISQVSTSFNQDVSNSTTTIIDGVGSSSSQIKRKQIKMKQGSSFGAPMVMVGDSAAQMSMTTQPTNASTDQQLKSGGNVPQLNLNYISQDTGMSAIQQSATSPINMKSQIHQGHIASSSRRQMRETQRSKINMTQQDTARGTLPLPTGNIQSLQQQLELTNRSHLAHAPMHISDPLPVQAANQQLISHRAEQVAVINPRTLTSARRDREHQLRSVNAVASTHQPLEVPAPTNTTTVKNFKDFDKPTNPQLAIKYGKQYLTSYEMQEIIDYPQIYYVGESCKRKVQGSNSNDFNYGYDDNKGNYKVNLHDHIGYRYEIQQFLGKGSFGQALRCFDHKRQEVIALKVIKNKKKYYYQAGVELKILQYLKENDPDDTMNIIHMKDYVIFRKHLCISFELMSINLYDFLKLNEFDGLSLSLIRRFAIQLLYALKYLKENDIIHCDLKPENILLKDPTKSGIKIIDFGSSCFTEERVYTYIQSRFYRAPEIILGISYTTAIDMWSFGCIMAEFCVGYPIFPGEDEMEQLAMMMEVCDKPSSDVLKTSQRRKKFFNDDNTPILIPNRRNMVRVPGSKDLSEILDTDDDSFIDFVRRCLDWDPATRMSPDEALRHAWILEGLPPKVLIHHQKLHNIPTSDLPPKIREIRQQYLLKEQQQVQQQQHSDQQQQQLMMTQQFQHLQAADQHPIPNQQQQYRSEPRKQQSSILGYGGQNNQSAVIKRVSNQQLLGMTQQHHQGTNGGVVQSDTRLPQQQQFNQTQQIVTQQQLNQTQLLIMSQQQQQLLNLSNNGGLGTAFDQSQVQQNNLISPRTKKIVMNNNNINGAGGNQDTAANKNHLILKTTSNSKNQTNTTNQDTNKSLENTLRNRKIILSSGLKRSSDGGATIASGNNDQGIANFNNNNAAISTSLTRKQIIFANSNNGAGGASMASNISNAMISDL